MASGTINGTTNNQYIKSKIEWSSIKNISDNSSVVTASLYYMRTNIGFNTFGTGNFIVSIDGIEKVVSSYINVTENEWALAATVRRTIPHKGDGTKSITIKGDGKISGTTLNYTLCSGTVDLDTIPRASSLDSLSCETDYFTGELTYKYTPKSTSFYNKCNISLNLNGTYLGIKGISLGKKTASQNTATVTLSDEELSVIYNILPNTDNAILRFTLHTYSDSGYSEQIGNSSYKDIKLYIPNDSTTKPTVSMSLSSVNSLSSTFSSLYIQGKSRVKASFSGSSAKYGATITSYSMTVSGLGTYDSPYQSGWLSKSGSITVTGLVRDTRGYSASIDKTITVIPYSKPAVIPYGEEKSIVCARCTENGTLNPSGTYLCIKAGRKYSKVMSGSTQKNFCLLRYRYKTESATSYSDWMTLLSKGTTSSDQVDKVLEGITLDKKTSYVVQIGVVDDIGEAPDALEFSIPTEAVVMHLRKGGKGVGIGKYSENDNVLDIADDWDVWGRVYSLGKVKKEISRGDDFNNYKEFGVYNVTANAYAEGIANCPFPKAGTLIVSSGNGDGKQNGQYVYILQRYLTFDGKQEFYRVLSTGAEADVWIYGKWECKGNGLWANLFLSTSVAQSNHNLGRHSNGGCYYRVVNENQVYVTFNCAFTYSGSPITVSRDPIPEEYRPQRTVYAYVTTNNRGLARIYVSTSGDVVVEHVQNMASADATTTYTVTWIDGYIDYWV